MSEHTLWVMRQLGFSPSRTNATYVEFVKTYADSEGRRAHVAVQFDRAGGDIIAPALSGFEVSLHARLEPTLDDVAKAPAVMRADLYSLLHELNRSTPVVRRCEKCGAEVSAFYVVEGAITCGQCP